MEKNKFNPMDAINKNFPQRHLSGRIGKISGRSKGQIVIRHRGGYHKRLYRFIDYRRIAPRNSKGMPVRSLYHPKFGNHLTLLCYLSGIFSTIIQPAKLTSAGLIHNLSKDPQTPGDSASLIRLPTGSIIHNISLRPLGPGIITRASGCSTILIRSEHGSSLLKLKSGEIRLFNSRNTATLGSIANEGKFLRHLGKAGVSRHLGRRPRTRAYAKNPVTIQWVEGLKEERNRSLHKES